MRDYALKRAAARFASGLALEMAPLVMGPAGGSRPRATTTRAPAAPPTTTPAYVLRTLLPARLSAPVRAALPAATVDAPGVGLLAAALVRLDRGGAGTPAADVAAALAALGAAPGAGALPGVGDPAAALAAAVDARWLAARRERGPDGPIDLLALGDAALADGGEAVDAVIRAFFENADPVRALVEGARV